MILNFDATFAKVSEVAAVVMMTALVNRRMLLVSQKTAPVNPAMVMIANVDARVTVNHEKKNLPLKHQKMTLNFDATFVKASDVVAAVVMTTAPVNQRMSLASRRMLPVNLVMARNANVDARVAREVANLEKMILPPKLQKTILNFDATFAKTSKVVAVVMTAPVNQRMLLVLQRMSLASRRMLPVNRVMARNADVDARVAREVANLEKIKLPLQHQKMILNFDATCAKASEVVAVVMTAPVNQRMLLVLLVMIAKIAENVKVVVILMTLLMNQKLPQFLVDSFEKKKSEELTQPRSLVTEPKNPALVMIANVDVKVARGAANHEKVKMTRQKHLRFLHFDELLNEMVAANAERVLTRQSLTD